MMLNNWVQQLLADIERLTLGYESVILAVTVLIGLVTIIFFIVVWSYVDPYEKAINELQTQNRQYPLASLFVAVRNDAIAPPYMARKPILAKSDFRFGANAPIPPS